MDVAVAADIRVVLVGALEEDLVLELRQALVCFHGFPDWYVGLLEGCPGLVMDSIWQM